jgi:hypothetical protein
MRKALHRNVGQRSSIPVVFGVAGEAVCFAGGIPHGAVHGRGVLHLGSDRCVTVHAAVGHVHGREGPGVAGGAILDLSVRAGPSQRAARLGIERAGAEQGVPARVGDPHDCQQGQESDDEAGGGETSETIVH